MRALAEIETKKNLLLAEQARARKETESLAQGNERKAFLNGEAHMEMRIPATSYLHWQRKKPGCWDDKQFCKEYLRDVPEARVKHVCARPISSLATVAADRVDALFGPDGRMRRRKAS